MATPNPARQGAREVYGAVSLGTPNGDSAMDETNDALRVNVVAGAVGGAGGTSSSDDSAFTPGTGLGTPIMAFADEVAPDSVDEGDVGVVRMTLTRALHVNLRDSSGTELSLSSGTEYAEDTVSTAGDKITMAGVVRADTAASLVGTDGDRTQMQVDAIGRLYVNASGVAVPVTDNSGSLTVDNPILSVVGGGTEATAQRVTIATDSTGVLSVDDNAGSLTVDNPVLSVVDNGTAATAQRVTIASDSTGVLAVTDNGGSLTVDNPVLSVVGNGVAATAQRVTLASDSTGVIGVTDNGGSLTVDGTVAATQSGTWTVQPGDTPNTVPWLVTANGDVDHDAVNTLKQIQIGGNAAATNVNPTAVASGDRVRAWFDTYGRQVVTERRVATYRAAFRLAVINSEPGLTFTHAANTNKQYATIFHANTAVKLVRMRKIWLYFSSVATAAGTFSFELHPINSSTTPATGNPAITPAKFNQADGAAEATCLALPTTAGTLTSNNSPLNSIRQDYGATTASPTTNPLPVKYPIELWTALGDHDSDWPTIRPGVAEGYAVVVRSSGASVTRFTVLMEFTEETP